LKTPEDIARSYADSLAGSTDAEAAATLAEWGYVDALCRHDWLYEYSDDPRVFAKGRESWNRIRAMQPAVDPQFELWNKYCHRDFIVNRD
jgi:hypothetical protein